MIAKSRTQACKLYEDQNEGTVKHTRMHSTSNELMINLFTSFLQSYLPVRRLRARRVDAWMRCRKLRAPWIPPQAQRLESELKKLRNRMSLLEAMQHYLEHELPLLERNAREKMDATVLRSRPP